MTRIAMRCTQAVALLLMWGCTLNATEDGGVSPDGSQQDAGPGQDAGVPGVPCTEAPPPCELTHGVCHQRTRACTDAGVYETRCTELSYGALFETVERRCDGIDNDCDGRVDVSWTVRLSETPGHTGERYGVDVMRVADGGFVAVLGYPYPATLLRLNGSLEVVATEKMFEVAAPRDNGPLNVFPVRDGWLVVKSAGPCMWTYLNGLGELERHADGGVFVREFGASQACLTPRAVVSDAGVVFTTRSPAPNGSIVISDWDGRIRHDAPIGDGGRDALMPFLFADGSIGVATHSRYAGLGFGGADWLDEEVWSWDARQVAVEQRWATDAGFIGWTALATPPELRVPKNSEWLIAQWSHFESGALWRLRGDGGAERWLANAGDRFGHAQTDAGLLVFTTLTFSDGGTSVAYKVEDRPPVMLQVLPGGPSDGGEATVGVGAASLLAVPGEAYVGVFMRRRLETSTALEVDAVRFCPKP